MHSSRQASMQASRRAHTDKKRLQSDEAIIFLFEQQEKGMEIKIVKLLK